MEKQNPEGTERVITGWAFINIWGKTQNVRHFFMDDGKSLCTHKDSYYVIDANVVGDDVPDDDSLNCRACRNIKRRNHCAS